MIEVSVIDTGIGIKKKDQSKLFELFGFLDSSKELNQKGIGLGLHISKQISQQLGGDIQF
jgi:signal transduction histidine kinase